MAAGDQPWPFPGKRNEQLREMAAKIDADVAAWRAEAAKVIANFSVGHAGFDDVRALLERVVAVRA